MSSKENKSQSEANNKYNQKSIYFNSDLNLVQEPQLPKEKQTELESVKFLERKIGNYLDNYLMKSSFIDKDFFSPIKSDHKLQNTNSPLNKSKKINFFKSNKTNLFDKKEKLEKIFCNCKKTRCKKKYCECFANKRLCKDCNCIKCLNTIINSNSNNKDSNEFSENEEIFCSCIKSNCNKKYCECYKFGNKCNDKCKCSDCLNNKNTLLKINNKDESTKGKINDLYNNNSKELKEQKEKLDLDKKKSNSNSRKPSSDDDSDKSYQIQRISIFINRNQTLVNVEKFSKEVMQLLSKKRAKNPKI